MPLSQKQTLGQFFTTNASLILDGMSLPSPFHSLSVIEPFAGNKDLLEHFKSESPVICYDIDPKHPDIQQRDSLLNPPDYTNKFVITNPPFLARNKSDSKGVFDKYGQNDLFKCFLETILSIPPDGGIIVLPLNFWCSIRRADISLRQRFIETFDIERVNLFEEQVFNDTTSAVCSVSFRLTSEKEKKNSIPFVIYPDKTLFSFTLSKETNYGIGGDIYSLPQSREIYVNRLTRKNVDSKGITNLKIWALDGKSSESRIRLEYSQDRFVDLTPNLSERSFATLVILPEISEEIQLELVRSFNSFLDEKRWAYRSLFLSSYRESTRKRISFDLVYRIVNFLLANLMPI